MRTLYLITHAHTSADPAADARTWHLSELGGVQAQRLAEQPWWADVTHVALSSEAKTRLTVAPVLRQRPLSVVTDARFDELKRGGWLPDYAAQVRRAFAAPAEAIDGWEPAAAALARFRAGIDDLAAAHPGAVVALVSHGLVLSLYRAWLLGYDRVRFNDWQQLSFAAVAQVDPAQRTVLKDFTPVAGHQPRG